MNITMIDEGCCWSIKSLSDLRWGCSGEASDIETAKRITKIIIENLTKRYGSVPDDLSVYLVSS
jgi:hypothetical protein